MIRKIGLSAIMAISMTAFGAGPSPSRDPGNCTRQVAKNCVVTFEFTLNNDRGELIDTTRNDQPLVYLHGGQDVIPGVQRVLDGRRKGEKFNATVPPSEGYGIYNPKLIQTVPRNLFSPNAEIKVGQQFHAKLDDGSLRVITVLATNSDSITINGNHPLAGVPLHFAIEILEIRPATSKELKTGKVEQAQPQPKVKRDQA